MPMELDVFKRSKKSGFLVLDRLYAVPKMKYTTLGQKFYCYSKLTTTRRRKYLQNWFLEQLFILSHDLTNADGIRRF